MAVNSVEECLEAVRLKAEAFEDAAKLCRPRSAAQIANEWRAVGMRDAAALMMPARAEAWAAAEMHRRADEQCRNVNDVYGDAKIIRVTDG